MKTKNIIFTNRTVAEAAARYAREVDHVALVEPCFVVRIVDNGESTDKLIANIRAGKRNVTERIP